MYICQRYEKTTPHPLPPLPWEGVEGLGLAHGTNAVDSSDKYDECIFLFRKIGADFADDKVRVGTNIFDTEPFK